MKYLDSIDLSNKNVLLRLDLDVPVRGGKITDDSRLQYGLPTLQFLVRAGARVTVVGHLGAPKGTGDRNLSLKPIRAWIRERFPEITVLENLRFDPGEGENSLPYAKDIVRRSKAQFYVFDAFAVSHRPHASVVGIPKLLPTVEGFRFRQELEALGKIVDKPRRPLVVVLGGAKTSSKLPLAIELAKQADTVLLGGLFPRETSTARFSGSRADVRFAELTADGLDITAATAIEFSRIISQAGTVVWNGPMGAFEESAQFRIQNSESRIDGSAEERIRNTPAWGTYVVAKAVSSTPAFTVVGGGDTEAALTRFGLESGIDWISSGGGAMLHYLAYRTLPFLEAVREK